MMPRDIEEFLKMAAQRRQQQKQRTTRDQPAAGKKPPVQRQPPTARLVPSTKGPLRPGEEIRILARSGEPVDMRDQSVSDHVRSHIDTSGLGEHASQLGYEVGLADDKLDARLIRKFDHSVSHLRTGGSAQDVTTSITNRDISRLAFELVTMLRSPQSIRQAILLSEVLKRPEI